MRHRRLHLAGGDAEVDELDDVVGPPVLAQLLLELAEGARAQSTNIWTNEPVLLRDDQWDSLTLASHNFLTDLNRRLLDERLSAEIGATIRDLSPNR